MASTGSMGRASRTGIGRSAGSVLILESRNSSAFYLGYIPRAKSIYDGIRRKDRQHGNFRYRDTGLITKGCPPVQSPVAEKIRILLYEYEYSFRNGGTWTLMRYLFLLVINPLPVYDLVDLMDGS